eukprot:6196809-Pleurochrysis_carterae.AAC.3
MHMHGRNELVASRHIPSEMRWQNGEAYCTRPEFLNARPSQALSPHSNRRLARRRSCTARTKRSPRPTGISTRRASSRTCAQR